jgi:hypothetical protein
MKRTITLRVDVADADEYADAVEAIVYRNATYISDAQWTRGEEIRSILQGRGHDLEWGTGKVGNWLPGRAPRVVRTGRASDIPPPMLRSPLLRASPIDSGPLSERPRSLGSGRARAHCRWCRLGWKQFRASELGSFLEASIWLYAPTDIDPRP